MTESILNSTKKVLGLAADYTAFDQDVIMHINSVLGTLNQLGIGPAEGLLVEDDTTEWAELTDDLRLAPVKSYVYLRVRMLFDSDTMPGPVIASFQEQIKELEWRLNAMQEYITTPEPSPIVPNPDDDIYYGGWL